MKYRNLIIILTLLFSPVYAEEVRPLELTGIDIPSHLESILFNAVRQHNLAVEGDKAVAEKVVKQLEAIEPTNAEDHPVILAYLGSSYTLMGRDASSVVDAMRYTNRGIRIIDEAIELAPDSLPIRMVRAMNNYALPAMFDRKSVAISDMERIVTLYDKEPSRYPAATLIPVLNNLIEASTAEGNDKAVEAWREKLSNINSK